MVKIAWQKKYLKTTLLFVNTNYVALYHHILFHIDVYIHKKHLDRHTLKNTDHIGAILQKLESFPGKNTNIFIRKEWGSLSTSVGKMSDF